MPKRSMKQDDPLEDFSRREITLDGVAKIVYVAGAGPAVIVMTYAALAQTGSGVGKGGFDVDSIEMFLQLANVQFVALDEVHKVVEDMKSVSADVTRQLAEGDRASRPVLGSPDLRARACRAPGTGVETDHDFRIEHGEQSFEIAAAKRGKEGVDDGALTADVGVGSRCSAYAAAGAAGKLPRRVG